jgi:hypothetical protein
MLQKVLEELQATRGTAQLSELAVRLKLEPSALEGMLTFWAGKGKLTPVSIEGGTASCAAPCVGSCPGATACPFVAKIPKMYEVNR